MEKSTINDLKKKLWDTADELRANTGLKALEYSTPILGLIFKSPRMKNKIQYNFYEEKYISVIKMCIVETSFEKRMELLDSLDGIGVPIASTVIHFIKPEVFPIIDTRTIGCLNENLIFEF